MKHFLALSFAALLAQMNAHARVGETREEIAIRYGEGKLMPSQRLAGTESFEYSKSGFIVEVVILDGKSVMEIYARKEGTSDEAIKELLKRVNVERLSIELREKMIGGKVSGGVGSALLAWLVSSLLVGALFATLGTMLTGMIAIGVLAGIGGLFLAFLDAGARLVGAIVGGLMA